MDQGLDLKESSTFAHSFVGSQLSSYMASVEEIDQSDSGMGSSDARSPEVKSLLPDDEDDEEVFHSRTLTIHGFHFLVRSPRYSPDRIFSKQRGKLTSSS